MDVTSPHFRRGSPERVDFPTPLDSEKKSPTGAVVEDPELPIELSERE